MRLALLLTALVLLALPVADAAAAPDPLSPTGTHSWRARVERPVWASSAPGGGVRLSRLGRSAPYWGGRNDLLVTASAAYNGERWVQVLLKQPPAGSRGWVPASAVHLLRTRLNVRIDLSARRLTVRRGARPLLSTPTIVGKRSTPTPRGLFAVDALVRLPADNQLGSLVVAVVAYSRTLETYGGGLPQMGIHAYERLGDPLGTARSHGCVRVPTAAVRRIARLVVRGAPVRVVA